MAVENDRVAKQFERSFGPAAKRAHDQVLALGAVIPKTNTELEESAIYLNNFAQGLGFAGPQAAALSVQLMKMAADLAGFSGKTFEEALEGLERGLMGSTKGLKSMGVALQASQVEQEAYRLGLLGIGQELTPVGTAMATFSLLSKQAGKWTGEAAKIAESAQGQWRMVGRDFLQLADDASNVLIPALMSLARVLREFVSWLRDIPTWLVKLVAGLVGFAAVMGPVIYLVANLIKYLSLLKVAIGLLAGANGLAGLVGLLAAPQVVGALVLIAGAVGALILVWRAFNKEVTKTPKPEDMAPPIDVAALLKMGGNDPSATTKGDPLQQMQKHASGLTAVFTDAMQFGNGVADVLAEMIKLQAKSAALWAQQTDKSGEFAVGLREIQRRMQDIVETVGVARGTQSPEGASRALVSPGQLNFDLARSRIDEMTQLRAREAAMRLADDFDAARVALVSWKEDLRNSTRDLALRFHRLLLPDTFKASDEGFVKAGENQRAISNDLALREVLLRLPDGFQAARLAAVEMGEESRSVGNSFHTNMAKLQQSWASPRMVGTGAMAGLEAAVMSVTSAFTPMALIITMVNKILEGLAPFLEAVLQPLVELGKIIGIIIGPLMRPLFQALKIFGIVLTIINEAVARVAAAILHVVSWIVRGIAGLIGWIPGLGGVAKKMKDFAKQLDTYGNDAQKNADALKRARGDLEHLNYGDTVDGVNALGDAARSTAEALLNIPTGFRIALDRFNATQPIPLPNGGTTPTPTTPAPSPTPTGTATGGSSGSGGEGDGGDGGDSGYGNGSPAFAMRATPTEIKTAEPVPVVIQETSPTEAPASAVIQLVVDGRVLGTAVLENLQKKAQAKFGTTLRWSEVQA
jgi:hypothetical protein